MFVKMLICNEITRCQPESLQKKPLNLPVQLRFLLAKFYHVVFDVFLSTAFVK